MNHGEIFKKFVIPELESVCPKLVSNGYNFMAFKNFARKATAQDRRGLKESHKKKAAAGQKCQDIWLNVVETVNSKAPDAQIAHHVTLLVDCIDRWENHESPVGFIANPNSQGSWRDDTVEKYDEIYISGDGTETIIPKKQKDQ